MNSPADQKIKVSACVIAYNHEKYLARALEGALAQKADFSYEIIIGEDCSRDRTREIAIDYRKKYPDKIRLLLHEKNMGMLGNWVDTINACKGEYIAMLESDDYWTDPYKLQKQIDFLENHPDYSISSHNVRTIDEETSKERLGKQKKDTLTLKDLLKDGSGGATCSLVFRNKIFGEFPDWYQRQSGGDWALQILCACKGKMKYFPEVMGVYHRHSGGSKSVIIKEAKKNNLDTIALPLKYTLQDIDAVDMYFSYKYSGLLDHQRKRCYRGIFDAYFYEGDFITAKEYARKLLPILLFQRPKEMLKILATVFLPKKLLISIRPLYKILR
jgi:glycosyltransferase involved in cell wall biosynthesis